MGIITIIEIVLLLIIIYFQLNSFFKTDKKIKEYSKLIPSLGNYTIKGFRFHKNAIEAGADKIVLNPADFHNKVFVVSKSENEEVQLNFLYDSDNTAETIPVSLISLKKAGSAAFSKIANALNRYLLKNKGTTADFGIMQDVVSRNTDVEEEEITNATNIPLYLGLMGTMLGIILGLANLYKSGSQSKEEFDPTDFLGVVALAMIASLLGLLLTVLTNVRFKDARKNHEITKNDFFTFLQTELMPVVNSGVSNAVYTLRDVVVDFSSKFSSNLGTLNALFDKNYATLRTQSDILEKLESIDVKNFASANVKILKELNVATEKLHYFQQYIDSFNGMMFETNKTTMTIQSLLNGVNSFEEVAKKLDQRVEESSSLLKFVSDHISFLRDNSEQIKSMSSEFVDFTQVSMNTLQSSSKDMLGRFSQFANDEIDVLTEQFNRAQPNFENLNHLSRLEKIEERIELQSNKIAEFDTETLNEVLKESKDENTKILAALTEVKNAVENIKLETKGASGNFLNNEERNKIMELIELQLEDAKLSWIKKIFLHPKFKK